MIEPNRNSLIIEKLELVTATSSGIVMPSDQQERFWRVKVIAFGEDVEKITGIQVRLGNILITNPVPEIDRHIIDPDNPNHLFMSANYILGRVI